MYFRSMSELSEAIRRKAVSPVDVTRDMLDRIAATDADYRANVTVVADRAMPQAKAAEIAIRRRGWRGPLHTSTPISRRPPVAVLVAVRQGTRECPYIGPRLARVSTQIPKLDVAGSTPVARSFFRASRGPGEGGWASV